MSGVNIYDPTTTVANPAYNPALPTGPSNFPYTRSQFPGNQIPIDRINPKLEAFLLAAPARTKHDDDVYGPGLQQLP